MYKDEFNFYFAKPINEILANVNVNHVILFKDYLFFDDINEYLKRPYAQEEVPPRINILTDFYANQYKETRPNLVITEQNKIIKKRNEKQAKLFFTNLEEQQTESRNDGKPQKTQKKTNQDKEKDPEKILNSNFSNYVPVSEDLMISQQDSNIFVKEYPKMEIISYQSSSHDIYKPSFTQTFVGDSQKVQNIEQEIYESQQENNLQSKYMVSMNQLQVKTKQFLQNIVQKMKEDIKLDINIEAIQLITDRQKIKQSLDLQNQYIESRQSLDQPQLTQESVTSPCKEVLKSPLKNTFIPDLKDKISSLKLNDYKFKLNETKDLIANGIQTDRILSSTKNLQINQIKTDRETPREHFNNKKQQKQLYYNKNSQPKTKTRKCETSRNCKKMDGKNFTKIDFKKDNKNSKKILFSFRKKDPQSQQNSLNNILKSNLNLSKDKKIPKISNKIIQNAINMIKNGEKLPITQVESNKNLIGYQKFLSNQLHIEKEKEIQFKQQGLLTERNETPTSEKQYFLTKIIKQKVQDEQKKSRNQVNQTKRRKEQTNSQQKISQTQREFKNNFQSKDEKNQDLVSVQISANLSSSKPILRQIKTNILMSYSSILNSTLSPKNIKTKNYMECTPRTDRINHSPRIPTQQSIEKNKDRKKVAQTHRETSGKPECLNIVVGKYTSDNNEQLYGQQQTQKLVYEGNRKDDIKNKKIVYSKQGKTRQRNQNQNDKFFKQPQSQFLKLHYSINSSNGTDKHGSDPKNIQHDKTEFVKMISSQKNSCTFNQTTQNTLNMQTSDKWKNNK